METNFADNNHITLVGKITDEEKFYTFDLSVPRLSGNADIIPVTISERLFKDEDLVVDKKVKITGQFRSYNSYENERNRLILTVFAKDIEFLPNQEEEVVASKDLISNEVVLTGYICKPPIYRQTPFGREIADILLAVNRAYNKSDYIPCITWGRNARFCSKMEVGTEVKVIGRVQSRAYEKKHEDGTVEQKVAYEVSISNLEVVDENKNDEDSTSEENNESLNSQLEENNETAQA